MASEIPNPLPSVLPIGAMSNGYKAASEPVLRDGLYYADWRDGGWKAQHARPETIDWSSLPASPATPPDVAAPGDRLFDNGRCCLCGDGVPDWTSDGGDDWYCTPCAERFGQPGSKESRAGAAREFARRRAIQTPPAPEKCASCRGDHRVLECEACGKAIAGPTAPKGEGERKGADACSHTRRFNSGICVQCGDLGPVEQGKFTDAAGNEYQLGAYAITGGGESDSEAVARRERVARIQAILNCPHANVNHLMGNCLDCGVSDKEFHVLRTHEPHGRSNYGYGGIDRRIAAARQEADGKVPAKESAHPRNWPEGSGEELFSTTSSRGGA